MFCNSTTYCKSTCSDSTEVSQCDVYWDNYRLGKVCYTYDGRSSKGEVVYRSEELSHIPEVLARKFFEIPSMTDLKKSYERRQIYDPHDLLSDSR